MKKRVVDKTRVRRVYKHSTPVQSTHCVTWVVSPPAQCDLSGSNFFVHHQNRALRVDAEESTPLPRGSNTMLARRLLPLQPDGRQAISTDFRSSLLEYKLSQQTSAARTELAAYSSSGSDSLPSLLTSAFLSRTLRSMPTHV